MQTGILEPVPAQARHLFFRLVPGAPPDAVRRVLRELAVAANGRDVVVGIGSPLAAVLGVTLPGLRTFPAMRTTGADAVDVPATQSALWCWVRGVGKHAAPADAGGLLHAGRQLEKILAPAFRLDTALEVFRHGSGRDLTGYEDGTENPQGDDADAAAIVHGAGAGLDGGSFAAFQQWQHDFQGFDAMSPDAQDNAIGRRLADNEELEDAPESAHVKRTAQESFDPEAFVVRRSMPWVEGARAGLAFLAFGKTLDAFEAQMRRMAGLDDGIVDALFRFSRPVSGAYFWCPPVQQGALDGSHLDLL
jgi:putative iron-dependent peroxidase